LEKSLESDAHYTEKFNRHMDAEALMLDKAIDYSRLPDCLLAPISGRYSIEKFGMYALMHQGYQIQKEQSDNIHSGWFSQWDDRWFLRNTISKLRVMDVVAKYNDEYARDLAARNVPISHDLDDIYEHMGDLQRFQILTSSNAHKIFSQYIKDNPKMANYATFLVKALEYNEGMRLIRSKSLYDLITGSIQEGKKPLQELQSLLAERKATSAGSYLI
jgi:hypothetical protein